jgi:hypothetical protein
MIINPYILGDGSTIPWSPSDMTTKAWYDADDASTITESSGLVSQWDDKSGSGLHIIQNTGSEKPTTGTRTINGKNVIDYDGTTDIIFEANNDMFRNVGSGMIIGVVKTDDGTGVEVVAKVLTPSFPNARAEMRFDTSKFSGAGRRLDGDTTVELDAAATFDTNEHVFGILFDWANAEMNFSIDGTLETAQAFQTAGNTSDTDSLQLNIGDSGSGEHFDGVIAELIFVEDDLSLANRQKLEGYLAWKWGLEASLPVGHPYLLAAPLQTQPWTPLHDPLLVAFYDATNSASIKTLDAANRVSSWEDISGNDHHLFQSTAGAQPRTGTQTQNGHNVIVTDTDGMYLDQNSVDDLPVNANGDHAGYGYFGDLVVNHESDSIWALDGTGDVQFDAHDTVDFKGRVNTAGFGTLDIAGDSAHNGPSVYGLQFDFTGDGDYQAYFDGVGNTNGPYTTYNSGKLSTAQELTMFINRGKSRAIDGFCLGLAFTDDASDATRLIYEGYWAHKGGTQANLPGGHPYLTNPPTV